MTANGATESTPPHVERARLPVVQKVTERAPAVSLIETSTARAAVVNAVTATPARSSVTTSGFESRIETATTIATAPAAPRQAAIDARPVLNAAPRATAATAPSAAPPETPTRAGSARGLPRDPCMRAPATARPPPTMTAIAIRGARMFQTTSGEVAATPMRRAAAAARIRVSASAAVTQGQRSVTRIGPGRCAALR